MILVTEEKKKRLRGRSTHLFQTETRMKPTFEIKKTTNEKFMFNLKAANNEVILTSQTYESKQAAEEGIVSVKVNSQIDARYEEKMGTDGKPYFVLHAANKLVIGRSEMYASHEGMQKGMASVRRNGPIAEIVDLAAHAKV